MKNLVVCCDGTNNQLAGDLTNVVRLFEVAIKNDEQCAFYDPGVGTLADPQAQGPLSKRWSLVKGLAFGTGLDENVFEAYRYLMRVYEPGDRIYLFGFSRGAFTVRVLAGMLKSVGLLHDRTENLLPYIWETYRRSRDVTPTSTPEEQAAAAVSREERDLILRAFTRPCPVHFLGVWDTVGSVGMYNWNQAYPYTYQNDSVAVVRHAVALDEMRAAFRSNVFKADPTLILESAGMPEMTGRPRVMNVWFPGVHSDIGGGYPWPECSGLAMVAFEWMVRESRRAKMQVDPEKLKALLAECPPDPCGPMHVSLQGGWRVIEYLPALRYDWSRKKTAWRFQPNKPRTMLESPILHRSVLTRMEKCPGYRPPSLPAQQNFPTED